jgi:hypothetical protein
MASVEMLILKSHVLQYAIFNPILVVSSNDAKNSGVEHYALLV